MDTPTSAPGADENPSQAPDEAMDPTGQQPPPHPDGAHVERARDHQGFAGEPRDQQGFAGEPRGQWSAVDPEADYPTGGLPMYQDPDRTGSGPAVHDPDTPGAGQDVPAGPNPWAEGAFGEQDAFGGGDATAPDASFGDPTMVAGASATSAYPSIGPDQGREQSPTDYGHVDPPPAVPLHEDDLQRTPWAERNRNALVIGIIALIVLALVAGFFVWRSITAAQFDERLTTQQDQAQQVVTEYLTALENADSGALTVTASRSPEDALVGDALLARSQELGGVSEVNVDGANIVHDARARTIGTSGTVSAAYSVGDEPVEVNIPVVQEGGSWKVLEVTAPVEFGSEDSSRTVNGEPATTAVVNLAPGTYEVGSSSPHLEYADSELVVPAPGAVDGSAPTWEGGAPTLSEEGEEAVLTAAETSLNACMNTKSLNPEGCPFAVDPGNLEVDESSIDYSLANDPWTDAEVTFDAATGTATGTVEVSYTLDASATQNGQEGTVSQTYDTPATYTADLSEDEPEITWSN